MDWPPSLWAATTPPGPVCAALEHDEETEIAVIGGGFTGLSAALRAGAIIHGRSPAHAIERRGQSWVTHTRGASLVSQHVLICTNGYTSDLWPGLERAVVPVASFIAATHSLGNNLRRSVLPHLHAVSETRRIQAYYRMDAQGRFELNNR